jgi:hypothetical protein
MKKYLLLLLLASFSVEAQIINIPDANFKAKLLEASPDNEIAFSTQNQYFKIDANEDGEIQESEALLVKRLNVSNSSISSLDGITSFSNLQILTASYNNLTQIDFIGLNILFDVKIDNNQITTIIGFSNNYIMLDLSHNAITSFDSNDYGTYINELDLSNNPLTYFNFNIDSLNDIYNLKLNNTLLENVTGNLNGIYYLEMNENQFLSSVAITVLTYNEYIRFDGNPMLNSVVIDGQNFAYHVVIENNEQLATVNLSGIDGAYLNINNNPLTSIILSNCDVSGVEVTESNLAVLDLSGVKFNMLLFDDNLLLQQLNLKNGFNYDNNPNNIDFNFQSGSSDWNCPELAFICANEWDVQGIQDYLILFETYNINVNSYCSFIPGGEFYTIQGNSKLELSGNSCDENSIDFPNLKFNITNGTISGNIISNTSGDYSITVQEGTHTITPVFENSTYFNVTPSNVAVTFPSETSPFTQNFCITPNGVHPDVEVVIIPLNASIPGFDVSYKLVYKNKGNTTVSGSISFTFMDNVMDFLEATPVPSMIEPTILNWNYTNLQPFETRYIYVTFNLNSPQETPALNDGDILEFIAIIDPLSGDEMPSDNTSNLNQEVVNSYDPNDKTCLEGSVVSSELIGQYVHYVIRFENTGTFFAQNVVVKDEIDLSKFDLNSMVVLSASHQQWTRINDNKVEFIFENIQLPFPPSEERHGYILFKIKLKENLTVGDTFSNFASIYFDYNFPIITEPATTSIEALSNPDFEFSNFVKLYPNPSNSTITIESQIINLKSVEIFNSLGQLVQAIPNENNQLNIDVSNFQTGTYFVKVHSDKGVGVSKFVKQ